MKQLKFEHQFAQAIRTGDKNATFRVNDDKDIRVGDSVELVDKVERDRPVTWEVTGLLHIKDVSEQPLTSLDESLLARGESFKNVSELLQVFQRFYGEHVNSETLVSVITFEFQAYEKPKKFLDNVSHTQIGGLQEAKLYADGGSRGNPGPSASGFVVMDMNNIVLHADNKYLGITTNNQAEYHACLSGMQWCLEHHVSELHVYLDSLLVVNQMKGIFKVKNRDLWSLYETMQETVKKFKKVTFTHVPREMNKLADAEVNKALDAVKGADIAQ